jgi:hypothetical protein
MCSNPGLKDLRPRLSLLACLQGQIRLSVQGPQGVEMRGPASRGDSMSSPRSRARIRPSCCYSHVALPVGVGRSPLGHDQGRSEPNANCGGSRRLYRVRGGHQTTTISIEYGPPACAIPVGGSPISLALSIDGARLYVGVSPESLAIIHTATHQIKRLVIDDDAVDLAPTPDDKVVYSR